MPRLAVLGHPVAHSRSPAMQNAALAALGLGEEWSYEAIDVASEEFEERVRGMAAEGFAGANVTVPHKEAALALADAADDEAKGIGAANTLVFAAGRVRAQNTDAGGLIAALPHSFGGDRALVLGAGGAARAVIWALRSDGVVVDIWNRTEARAHKVHLELSDSIGVRDSIQVELNNETVVPHEPIGKEAGGGVVREFNQGEYGLIVNTTTVGLHGEDPFAPLRLVAKDFEPGQVVVDMVYGERPSTLLEAAAGTGATTVDGIEVLIQQGALSLQIWTGQEPPLDVMRAAARA